MLNLKNVSLNIGNTPILQDVTCEIPNDKLTAIVGPNGSGKSTLLNAISLTRAMSQGEVTLNGQIISELSRSELAEHLSILRQENAIDAKIQVTELVNFGRFPHHKGKPNQEDWNWVNKAICDVQLENECDKYLDALSGGQKQRAFIAMILAQQTQNILLDEPLNNLDMKHSVSVMQSLQKLADKEGKAIGIVIHDINFAARYCNHIIALKNGKCFYTGNCDDFFHDDVLTELFDMPMHVSTIDGKKVCLYYG
ncbi:MAG: ATP-binding cassette domain-containing protein [Pseudomonadota bacterium]